MNDGAAKQVNLDERLASMQEPPSDLDCLYHAITLTADDNLNVVFGTQTEWVGWTDDRRHEIRRSRLVYATFVDIWKTLELPYCYVHTVDDLTIFLVAGGNALVEHKLAERIFPNQLGPHPTIAHGPFGFQGPEMFDATAFRRAPTPKLRMRIFDRDGRRCTICGRRPDDNTDVVLHVHHIRPWEKGGVTDPKNLITLCHTCHAGLDPHHDPSLFSYISEKASDQNIYDQLEFFRSVANYRRAGFLGLAKQELSPTKRRGNRTRKTHT